MTDSALSTSTGVIPLPETLYLGAGHQVCVTLHRPPADASRAVVVVEPFGIEALAAESTHRRLTELLLTSGAAVVRFAPPGLGDSGEVVDGTFVTSWLDSVASVVSFARGLSCSRTVDVVGLRLGATVAAYATATVPVDRVVLWAPVAGKAFAREFKLLGATGVHSADPSALGTSPGHVASGLFTSQPGDIEAGGYVLSAESVALLTPLDLRTIETVGARNALLVDRDDLRSVDKVKQRFDAIGLPAEVIQPVGYAEMRLDDPEEGVVPEEALQEIVAWLSTPDAGDVGSGPIPDINEGTTSALEANATFTSHEEVATVPELRVRVGDTVVVESPTAVTVDGVALAALVSRPVENSTASNVARPAVVMLTTGSNPRCGAGRLQTLLARELASRGHIVLRYDRRGIGLSVDHRRPAVPPPVSAGERGIGPTATDAVDAYDPRHCRDLQAVVDYVRNTLQQPSVQLLGMCSGAYTAFHFVKSLKPVNGASPVEAVIAINQIIFLDRSWTTKADSPAMAVKAGYELRNAWRDPSRWKSLLSGGIPVKTTARRLTRLVGMRLGEVRSRVLVAARLQRPPALVEALLHIRKADIRQVYIFDDAETGLGQLRLDGRAACAALEKDQWMTIRTVAGAGHTFGPSASKRWLAAELAEVVANPPRDNP